MSQTFEDRVEEVLGVLHGMAWPLLEETEKKKITTKVAKGIEKGDTIAAWARALGVPDGTLRDRLKRLPTSDPIDGSRARSENDRIRVSHAKAVFKDDKLVDQLLEDRQAGTALAKAAARHQAKVEREVEAETKARAPGLVHRASWNAVAGDLLRVRNLYAKALDASRTLDLADDEAEALMEEVKDIAQITDWFESWLKSGAADFDTELDRILEAS